MPEGPDPAGEEADQEEEFYESLDRILSSSCSSTSASDDDADHRRRRRSNRNPPPHASAYDVWISEPTSVEERRRLLLQRLGLSSDPPLPPSPCRSPRSPSPPASPPASPPPRPEAPAEEPRSGGLGRPPLARDPSSSGGEQCRIRNLDDGTEFEVGEVHEEVVREEDLDALRRSCILSGADPDAAVAQSSRRRWPRRRTSGDESSSNGDANVG